ncbi:DUF2336 domain-containing protein [Bradyrhizobium sp. STM 3557]|uniref:DUF2336 domain-containing protein n=1 Tax=Bradyrhizobium sp. STM 3557 TaxID=578920 RepID=UPI00388F9FE6
MTTSPPFPGFDGLLSLSRREGVDIRPTLLRVLTDLYVQTQAHSADEERQFIELTSRLIDEVDDATRAAVRGRLAIYPAAPVMILRKLGLRPALDNQPMPLAAPLPAELLPQAVHEPLPAAAGLSMQPKDAAELAEMFFRAASSERVAILHNLASTPLKPATRIPRERAAHAVDALQMAAFISDIEIFTNELGESLILAQRIAEQIVEDASGEALACALKALDMPGAVFERVLLFLKPEVGQSVHAVFRLSRFYHRLSGHAALIMLAAWRGAAMASAARPKHRPALYDDERQRARGAARSPSPAAPGHVARTGTDGYKR